MLYSLAFKLFLSRLDPEDAHHLGMFAIRLASSLRLTKLLPKIRSASVSAFGLTFNAPFGLAAGFDKNAIAVRALGELGFSHVEVGTVTAIPQDGNETPRLFRLKADRALINRMGFNNDGAVVVAKRLEKLRASKQKLPIIGVNIGKSRVVEVEDAVSDYETSARLLAPFADYLAVNVSSPNTPGLRSLQSVEALKPILEAVLAQAKGKPVLVKIAPDLADDDVVAVANLAKKLGLAGVIATNTTISRAGLKTASPKVEAMGAGGLSGAPVNARSLEVLRLLKKTLGDDLAIVSVGGVETKEQVLERMKAGATLVQGYTGFIYFGPLWARKLNRI
ncbi:MAG: quinone-dependent dihydroorotate dehydrogenase [Actinobacteria bacterium]|uniref:dihydroorotate dehydrogenase (quinone) n=1 Tax=freshwater metagenome TaxID=449393 RepID=A0A6J6N0Z5_9ZZZZ|nr:quinone-dependent dihydroorotate dehydrogenase [Actinomycetota bacterium]